MVIGFIVALVLLGAGAFFSYSAYVNYKNASKCKGSYLKDPDTVSEKRYKKRGMLSVICIVIMFILFILVPWSFHTVDQSEVTVIKELGKIIDVREPGTYFDFWFTRSRINYDTKVQNLEIQSSAYSSDAQTMTYSMTVQYTILADKVREISTEYGNLNALESRIVAIVNDRTKSALSSHKAMDIIAKRAEMSPEINKVISEAVGEDYYVNIVSVAIADIEFSEAFENAVEDKMIAEQNQLKADYENAAKIAKAEADAKAKIMAAEAEAKANELLEKTLTDKILQEMYIDKWDGKLPEVMTGDDANVMIPIGEDKE